MSLIYIIELRNHKLVIWKYFFYFKIYGLFGKSRMDMVMWNKVFHIIKSCILTFYAVNVNVTFLFVHRHIGLLSN